jgi:hypothetical protein
MYSINVTKGVQLKIMFSRLCFRSSIKLFPDPVLWLSTRKTTFCLSFQYFFVFFAENVLIPILQTIFLYLAGGGGGLSAELSDLS